MSVTKDGQYIPVGPATFSWIEGQAFLKMSSPGGQFMPAAVWILFKDPMFTEYHVNYFDERGVARIFHMSFDGDAWTMSRNEPTFRQRFEAVRDNDRWVGKWERSANGKDWDHDFDLVYARRRAAP